MTCTANRSYHTRYRLRSGDMWYLVTGSIRRSPRCRIRLSSSLVYGKFSEFGSSRVHTREYSWGLFIARSLACGKRESVSQQRAMTNRRAVALVNWMNPMRGKNWRQEPGGKKGRHLWPRLVQKNLKETKSVGKKKKTHTHTSKSQIISLRDRVEELLFLGSEINHQSRWFLAPIISEPRDNDDSWVPQWPFFFLPASEIPVKERYYRSKYVPFMRAGLRSCRAPQATTPKREQKKNQRASTAACVYAKTGIFRATSQL